MLCTHPDCCKAIEVEMVFGTPKDRDREEVHPETVKCDEHENYEEKRNEDNSE